MNAQQIWIKEFDTAMALGFTAIQAAMLAEVAARKGGS